MANLNLVPTILSDILHALSHRIADSSKGVVNLKDAIVASEPGIQAHLTLVTDALGINLKDVENVVEYAKDASGKLAIYYPCIKAVNGGACLVWGKLVQPLASLKVLPSFQGEKYVNAEFDLPKNADDEIDVVSIPLRANKDYKPALTRQSARTLFMKGKLVEALQTGFGSGATNVKELEPGKYDVIEAKQVVGFKGAVKFEVFIRDHGWFAAPNKLGIKLEALGTEAISDSTPWGLTLGELKSMKADGREVTYRDVVYISTANIGSIDFSAFTFNTTPVDNASVPADLMVLDA